MVSIVFQHKMCVQTQWKPDCPSLKHAEARLHHHRGLAIRALNEDIANEKTQSSDVVLTGVILLLQSEVRYISLSVSAPLVLSELPYRYSRAFRQIGDTMSTAS